MLPSVSVTKKIDNSDTNRYYVIDPNGLNIRLAHSKYTDIRKKYTNAIESGQSKNRVKLDVKLTNDDRYYLKSIDYEDENYFMMVLDCYFNKLHVYNFKKDVVFYYTDNYVKKTKAYQKKMSKKFKKAKVHGNKKRPEGYWKTYGDNYGAAKYAFDHHNDIGAIYTFKEKYPESNAFSKIIANYEKGKKYQENAPKKTNANINPEVQQYIKRIIPLFRNISDETTFMTFLNLLIKNGDWKSHIDTKEMEKMKKEFSVMGDALALFD